jgi:hypothetical protein
VFVDDDSADGTAQHLRNSAATIGASIAFADSAGAGGAAVGALLKLCSNFNVYLGATLVARKRCLALSRRCEIRDPSFAAKLADMVGLYVVLAET